MKKKRLFYYEETVEAWCPVPDLVEQIISTETMNAEDIEEIRFKCVELTDEEMAALPVV